ncbi:MAG: hypothetical protein HQ465_20665 [Rhodospirillales bacterium]|nr:hypothetical protein [Rhodospirillales bacterium]
MDDKRMHEKTKTVAGIAAGLQGMTYDDKRLAELAAEVEILNDAVRKAAAQRLSFDDDPAAFASILAKEART